MKKYDAIVVGSGISGMTLALLLGAQGKSVLLLEKSATIGGSMARFRKQGIPLDTGFHFTGGFAEGGILSDMLIVLGLADEIEPQFVVDPADNCFIFEDSRRRYEFSLGTESAIASLKRYFPGQYAGIDAYFNRARRVCEGTVSMDLRTITLSARPLEEDYISLREVLDEAITDPELKALLSAYTMCYGTPPSEVSFAVHSRVSYNLYESVARVKGGGEAFIKAFRRRFAEYDIDVRVGAYITDCSDVKDRQVMSFGLNNGERVAADNCIFTIHPRHVLEILPKEHLSKAFVDRIEAFEPSVGFFSLYATVEGVPEFKPGIVSLYPGSDVDAMFIPGGTADPALVVMKNSEQAGGRTVNVLNAFELSFPEDVSAWAGSTTGNRPKEYQEYKRRRIERIKQRVLAVFPEYEPGLKVLDAASMLTLRDYLHTPDGSAYGIKQKLGQFNLFGKLPLRNLYAAGQSAVLPGLVGAMLSSFIIARSLTGKETYTEFINSRLS